MAEYFLTLEQTGVFSLGYYGAGRCDAEADLVAIDKRQPNNKTTVLITSHLPEGGQHA